MLAFQILDNRGDSNVSVTTWSRTNQPEWNWVDQTFGTTQKYRKRAAFPLRLLNMGDEPVKLTLPVVASPGQVWAVKDICYVEIYDAITGLPILGHDHHYVVACPMVHPENGRIIMPGNDVVTILPGGFIQSMPVVGAFVDLTGYKNNPVTEPGSDMDIYGLDLKPNLPEGATSSNNMRIGQGQVRVNANLDIP